MDDAPHQPVGQTILKAIQATRRYVKTNTNLGIVLLLSPLATIAPGQNLRRQIGRVLASLTVQDARDAYAAIRLAEPGGLGHVDDQDVIDEPTVTLREAMALAAERDMIALQYVNGFEEVFSGVDWLAVQLSQVEPLSSNDGRRFGRAVLERLIVELYFRLLMLQPDSLVKRKRGDHEARELQRLARDIVESTPDVRAKRLAVLESWFAAAFPHRNPGTTADFIAACLFVAFREGIIPMPEVPAFFTAPS